MDGEEREQREPGLMLFEQAVEQARVAICFSDMGAPDNPLTYVNPAFEAMTGYARAEAVGRNCRFLQGAGTDPAAVDRLRRAVAAGEPATVEILNYRRDGSPFWNALHIAPVLGPDGEVWNEAEALLVTYDPATMRPVPQPERLRDAWSRILVSR